MAVSGRQPHSTSGFSLHWARPEDAAALAGLAGELREALGQAPGALDAAAILRDGFGPRPEFDAIIARSGGADCGYALFRESYEPAYAARGLYLADLYVRPAWRRNGLGRALIAAVAAESRRRGRIFVWWVSVGAGRETQKFYEGLAMTSAPTTAYALTPFDEFDQLANEALPVLGRRIAAARNG